MNAQLTMFDDAPVARQPLKGRRLTREESRDRGIKQAIDHAHAVDATWGDVAFAALKVYLTCVPTGHKLTGEMIRQRAELVGVPKPPDKRAWGAVMLRASREGLIRKIGWTTAADPKVHCNPISEWCRL